jgi:hypothetical protein
MIFDDQWPYPSVKLKFHPIVGNHGTHRLPDLFYDGVFFGLTDEDSHDIEVS